MAEPAANAGNGEVNGNARDIEPERAESFWRSTGKYIWNKVMAISGLTLMDGIGWSDVEADNSISIMDTFLKSVIVNPPLVQNGTSVYKEDSILKAFSGGIRKIKQKFRQQMRDDPSGEYFPEDLVSEFRTKLKRKRGITMMEGIDASDLHKGTYPLPQKHSQSTRLFGDQFSDAEMADVRNIDALQVCIKLFRKGEFCRMAELNTTTRGIGRGGEAKFLTYKDMFPDSFLI